MTTSTGLLRREHSAFQLVEWSAVPRRMVLVWAALFLNVMTFFAIPTVVPIPGPIGQLLTQAALPLALGLALIVNRNLVVRPNLVLALMTISGIAAAITSLHSEFLLSSTFRASRLLAFVAVLWLLTPWWGRRDMLLLRCHRLCLWGVLATIILGMLVSPGLAYSFEGRLSGVVWPVLPTQVAHYAAVLFGTTAVLWMCQVITGRHAMVALVVSGYVLLAAHTRTALLACVIGIIVAAASLFLGHARVRRTSALGLLGLLVGVAMFASEVTRWLLRGQTPDEAGQLTGRTKVWSSVMSAPRPRLNEMFGSGLSNQSFNGLPIDSNWVGTYWDQGWFGVLLLIAVLAVLLSTAATRERGPQRATALFLIVYCIVASFTETGLGTPSPYFLELALAAALLAPPTRAGAVP